jgi:hypothetical protein
MELIERVETGELHDSQSWTVKKKRMLMSRMGLGNQK